MVLLEKPGDDIKDISDDWKMILKWIHVAQIEYQWRALVNTVIKLCVP
jgi:hypothetical protein